MLILLALTNVNTFFMHDYISRHGIHYGLTSKLVI